MNESLYEARNSIYCYDGTDVLVNYLEIKDNKTLQKAERKLVLAKLYELRQNKMVGNFDLTSYNKAKDRMILKNRENWRFSRKICNYSTEEAQRIIESGSRDEKILLSRHFFNLGG